jgi:hypothetical protein
MCLFELVVLADEGNDGGPQLLVAEVVVKPVPNIVDVTDMQPVL